MRFRGKQTRSGPARKSRHQREIRQAEPFSHARQRLFRESFGQFDEDAPVARVLDFSKGNDKPQPFDDVWIDLIVPKKLQQFVAGVIGILSFHRESSRREEQMASPENDFNELASIISTAIEKARQLNLHTSAYILSMVLVEVSEATKAASDDDKGNIQP